MELRMIAEAELFCHMILLGAFLAIVSEGLAFLRKIWHHRVAVIAMEDVLFWMMAGVLFIAMVYQENDGSFRGYLLLGLGIGAGSVWLVKRQIGRWRASGRDT